MQFLNFVFFFNTKKIYVYVHLVNKSTIFFLYFADRASQYIS